MPKIEKIEGIVVENNKDINLYLLEKLFFFRSRVTKGLSSLNWFENTFHRIPPYLIDNEFQVLERFNSIENTYIVRGKRIRDFLISLFLLIITSPLFFIISLLFFEDRGPLFYSQIRTGFKGEKIKITKFRSMVKDAEKFGVQWSKENDPRITKIGRVIRALRLDELQQLFIALEGKMSLIGPRAGRP